MKLSRLVRSGTLVGPGPAGGPPIIGGGLRTFETRDTSPVTDVLVRAAGSIVYLRSGLQSWINCNGTGTGWVDLAYLKSLGDREADRVDVTFGVNCTIFDSPAMNCDSKPGPRIVTFKGSTTTANMQAFLVRINGSTAGISLSGFYNDGGASVPINFGIATSQGPQVNTANPFVGAQWQYSFYIPQPESGRWRYLYAMMGGDFDGVGPVVRIERFVYEWQATTELQTIGLNCQDGNGMAASSTCRIVRL